jgi:thermitase
VTARTLAAALTICCGLPGGAAALAAPALEPPVRTGTFVPGEAIVRFKASADASERRSTRARADVELDRTLDLPRAQVVHVNGRVGPAVERLEDDPSVAYAQPNYRYEALAPPPNDSFFAQLWGLGETPGTGALSAWDRTRGAGAVIAVVDTGVDLTHPDLQPNLWSNPGEALNGADDDGNGIVDDIHGADFFDRDGNPDDYNFHGTHVAGTAAAVDGNALGIAGVAPDSRIMAVRALDGDGGGSSADIGDGIAYAAREGAHVINLSFGSAAGPGDQLLSDAVSLAGQRNAVVVAAAGNDGENNDAAPVTPCALPHSNLICVAAVGENGALAGFSNFGATTVDVGAPGVGIVSAKTDYGAPLFSDGFDGTLAQWDFFTEPGGVPWGQSSTAVSGQSAADSPAGAYANNSDSEMFTANAVSLAGRRGCRMHFDLDHDIHDSDALFAGAVTNDLDVDQVMAFAGDSGGFFPAEVSISDLDGRTDVFPIFALLSDGAATADGAYVDRLRLICRDSTYVDAITPLEDYDQAGAGNYVAFNGTSMASPHVAGVAALVRVADPGAPAAQIVQAIEDGAAPLPSLAGATSSGGAADADGAIVAALGLPNATPGGGGVGGGGGVEPAGPNAASLRDARGTIRVSRSGVFRYPIRAATGLQGTAVFRTRRKALVARRAHLTLARKRFSVPQGGRLTLRVRLSRREMRVLRRNRRLLLRVAVTVRDSAGRSATAARRLKLLPPRRR